jgi:uncharacterized protein YqgV (UPF0045/DUF77 family)
MRELPFIWLNSSIHNRGDRIIGEGKALAIQIGPDDTVIVRGSLADVARAVKEINEVVQEAKTDEIESGYVRASFRSSTCYGD